jgi:hypothetical protein
MGRGFESPHLHHGRRSLTCGFPYLDHGRGMLGPYPVRLRRQTGALMDPRRPPRPLSGTPLVCWRVLRLAADEAAARDQDLGPEHLLLGLLRDAQDPLGTSLYPQDRRLRGLLGLPNHGPHPIKLLVETRGLTLENLRAALLSELDTNQ